jgi:hypothetical protein
MVAWKLGQEREWESCSTRIFSVMVIAWRSESERQSRRALRSEAQVSDSIEKVWNQGNSWTHGRHSL